MTRTLIVVGAFALAVTRVTAQSQRLAVSPEADAVAIVAAGTPR